jgi:hypothetical protein
MNKMFHNPACRCCISHRVAKSNSQFQSSTYLTYLSLHVKRTLKRPTYAPSNPFLAPSTTLFTSPLPFSTTFSIAVPAFFNSSGLAVFANCIPRNFFCCLPRASLIAVPALSPALPASATAAFRESAVGGGMLITSSKGLAPVGSGCGVRERVEDWMAEETDLTCCEVVRIRKN